LSRGIPCIHSNINGIEEIITEGQTGFVFEYDESVLYNDIRFEQSFNRLQEIFNDNNKYNIKNALEKAYGISISKWNTMSQMCYLHTNFKYQKSYCIQQNILNFENIKYSPSTKMKLFVNFKPDITKAYGGGNISVFYLIQNLADKYSDFELTYELEPNTDLYLIIDPFKDRGLFKKYSLDDVIAFKKIHGGKIAIRVNDCDKTRVIENNSRSREFQIMKNHTEIDLFIFNSQYIKQYYFDKFQKANISDSINYKVVINGCDQKIFKNHHKQIDDTIRIVTHHWNNNMHKNYQLYYDL